MKSGLKQSHWIIIALLAAVAVAYALLIFVPQRAAIAEIRTELANKRQYVAQGGVLDARLKAVQQELDATNAYNAKSRAAAPTNKGLSSLFERISELVKSTGATTTRFDPEPAVPHEKITQITLSIGLTGSFPQILAFLSSLERLSPRVWVESVRLDAPPKDSEPMKGELSVAIFINNSDDSDYINRAE
jgi:Tfp pilus assembly protein PilO